jgi:hypothetical protein
MVVHFPLLGLFEVLSPPPSSYNESLKRSFNFLNINTLRQFRYDIYDCLERAKGALFNTVDALMTETEAKSLPEVTQSLWFERHWSSVYEAFGVTRWSK